MNVVSSTHLILQTSKDVSIEKIQLYIIYALLYRLHKTKDCRFYPIHNFISLHEKILRI